MPGVRARGVGKPSPVFSAASCDTRRKPAAARSLGVSLGKRPRGVGPGGREGAGLCMGTSPGETAAAATCRDSTAPPLPPTPGG